MPTPLTDEIDIATGSLNFSQETALTRLGDGFIVTNSGQANFVNSSRLYIRDSNGDAVTSVLFAQGGDIADNAQVNSDIGVVETAFGFAVGFTVRQSDGSGRTYIRTFDGDGAALSAPIFIGDRTGSMDLGATADGFYIVAQAEPDGSGAVDFNARDYLAFDADGAQVGSTIALPGSGPIRFTFTQDDGAFIVTDGSGSDAITASLYSSDGSLSMTYTLPIKPGNTYDIQVRADGSIAAFYQSTLNDDDGFRATQEVVLFDSSGAQIGDAVILRETAFNTDRSLVVEMLDDGGFVTAYVPSDADNNRDVVIQQFDANASPVGEPFTVNQELGGTQHLPEIEQLDDGNLVVFWGDVGSTRSATVRLFNLESEAPNNGDLGLGPVSDEVDVRADRINPFNGQDRVYDYQEGFIYFTAGENRFIGEVVASFYGSDGTLIDEIKVALGGGISTQTQLQGEIAFTATSYGFAIAFNTVGGDTYIRTFDDEGNALSDAISIGSGNFRPLNMGQTSDGNAWLINTEDANNVDVRTYRSFDQDGNIITAPVVIGGNNVNDQVITRVDGSFFLTEEVSSSSTDIILFTADGVESSRFSVDAATGGIEHIEELPDGGFAVTYVDTVFPSDTRFSLLYQRFDSDGNPVSTPAELFSGRPNADNYVAETLSDGSLVVLVALYNDPAVQNPDEADLYAYHFDIDGNPIRERIPVNVELPGIETNYEIDELADGTIVFSWFQNAPTRNFEPGRSETFRLFRLDAAAETAEPTDGDDVLTGGADDDVINGGVGNDVIDGGGGDDTLYGDSPLAIDPDSLEALIFRAYEAVFDRAPDLVGFTAFLTALRLGQLTQEDIIAEFVGSEEFQNTYGDLANRAFIEQLYRNVLDREGDASGIDAFTAALDGGRSRASVVAEFANSIEFIQSLDLATAAFAINAIPLPAEGEIFRAYQAVFDRLPDADGFINFVAAIVAGTLTLEQVVAEFVGSAEFAATYGSLNNADFVDLLYANVLPGNDDQSGRDAFTAALEAGSLSRAEVVAEFVQSFEFRAATADGASDFIADIYDFNSSDSLTGGAGNDILFGGRGDDLFIVGEGSDTVLDFASGRDTLDVSALGADFDTIEEILAVGTQEGRDAVFDFGGGNALRLENVDLDDLSASDFGLMSSSAAEAPAALASVQSGVLNMETLPVEAEPIIDTWDIDTWDDVWV